MAQSRVNDHCHKYHSEHANGPIRSFVGNDTNHDKREQTSYHKEIEHSSASSGARVSEIIVVVASLACTERKERLHSEEGNQQVESSGYQFMIVVVSVE